MTTFSQRISGAASVWAQGIAIGFATVRSEQVLGLKRLLLPASYWRTAEFAYVIRQIGASGTLLDLGSPKDLAGMLARRGFAVTATDILPSAVELSHRFAVAQGRAGSGAGRVHSEVQDGRALAYSSDSFDAAYSVSVLEHIPDDGDSRAIAELVRVVRPGGRIVLTVPYDRAYRETFVPQDVYERASNDGRPVFFERHYDASTLRSRLLSVAGVSCVDIEVWGEGAVPGQRLLSGLGPLRTLFSPLEAPLAAICLKPVSPSGHPMAAFVTLRKDLAHSKMA